MRVLILGCFSKMALAIINDLAVDGHEIVGGAAITDMVPIFRPEPWFKSPNIGDVFRYPNVGEQPQCFIESVIDACRRFEAEILVPIGQAITVSISRHKDRIIDETGAIVPVADYDKLSRFADKWATYQLARSLDILTPRTTPFTLKNLNFISELRFPLVIKPRHLTGSLGVKFFSSIQDLHSYVEGPGAAYLKVDDGEADSDDSSDSDKPSSAEAEQDDSSDSASAE